MSRSSSRTGREVSGAVSGKGSKGIKSAKIGKSSPDGKSARPSPSVKLEVDNSDSDTAQVKKSPALDYSTVTDDRWTADVYQCNVPSCMPDGCIKPEQFYACDRQVAKMLAQYVSPEDRKKVFQWLDTLEDMTLDEDQLSERSMYLTCLLMLLKSGQLIPPFSRTPPPCPLKQLREVIDKRLFKNVAIECRKRRVYERPEYVQPDRLDHLWPSQFFQDMPSPTTGLFCYGAAFSTM